MEYGMNKLKFFVLFLSISLAACAQSPVTIPAGIDQRIGIIPTGSPLPPYTTPTPYYSAPLDGSLDTACRITIDLFFSFKQGFSNEVYRELFVPSSMYLANNSTPPADARILLKLMPASQWWQENFPDKPIPGDLLPKSPNEYVYYTEFTYHYEPSTTPVSTFPDGWILHMIADGPNRCKIKSYGKG
jgi:hypothetical protein